MRDINVEQMQEIMKGKGADGQERCGFLTALNWEQ